MRQHASCMLLHGAITDLASPALRHVQRIRELNEPPDSAAAEGMAKLLRLSVEPGGCSGFQYQFNLEPTDSLEEEDA